LLGPQWSVGRDDSRDRAEEIAAIFAHPGDVIELRPDMWAGGPDT